MEADAELRVVVIYQLAQFIGIRPNGLATPSAAAVRSQSLVPRYHPAAMATAQHLGVPLVTEDRAIMVAFPDVAQSLLQATS